MRSQAGETCFGVRCHTEGRIRAKSNESRKQRRDRIRAQHAAAAQPKPAAKDGGQARSKHTWRIPIVVAALLLLAGLGGLGYFLLQDSPEEVAAKATNGEAKLLHHVKGTDSRHVFVLKLFHGGDTSFGGIVQDEAKLQAFLEHHNTLTRVPMELFKRFGPSRVRVIIEGYSEGDEMFAVVRDSKATLNAMENHLVLGLSRPANTVGRFRELDRYFVAGGPASIRLFSAQGRLPLQLLNSKTDGFEKVVLGADIKGHPPLTVRFMTKFNDLVKQEAEPTKAEIEAFSAWSKVASDEDNRLRHEYLAELVAKQPPGSVICILLGGSHSEYGARMELSAPQPSLEAAILARTPVHLSTYEERNYETLIGKGATGKLVIASDTSVEDLTFAIQGLRNQRRK